MSYKELKRASGAFVMRRVFNKTQILIVSDTAVSIIV